MPHLNSALFQKLCSSPPCLPSGDLLLPLCVMRVSVSARAAAVLVSISGSDRWTLILSPAKAAALHQHSTEVRQEVGSCSARQPAQLKVLPGPADEQTVNV